MTSLIDYIESEAKANAAFHIACSDALAKEANTLLNFLLAGAGGLAAYGVSIVGKVVPVWLPVSVGAASASLFVVAGVTLLKCLLVRPIWPPANEPGNYPTEGFEVDDVRIADLATRQACIDENRVRNDSVGMWLNRCRALAAFSPIVASVIGLAVASV